VNSVDLYITENYVLGTHASCKNVQFPSSGQLALDLMCGGWGSSKCSPINWFGFMGDANEDVVPFQINYKIQNSTKEVNGFTPLNPPVVPCNESVDVSNEKKMTINEQDTFCFLIYRAFDQLVHASTAFLLAQSRLHLSQFHRSSSSGASMDTSS
jgi:hypothetical protein